MGFHNKLRIPNNLITPNKLPILPLSLLINYMSPNKFPILQLGLLIMFHNRILILQLDLLITQPKDKFDSIILCVTY